MKRNVTLRLALAAMIVAVNAAVGAKPPLTWDGLEQVKSKRLDLVYLQPGADFRGYTKVILEPTEVAFAKDWKREYNRTARSLSSRVSDSDVQNAVSQGVAKASDIFSRAWAKGGYQVVTTPGPDVLRIQTGIVNIRVSAPDKMTAGRTHSFAGEAGHATLFVEARDSVSGALLGRAVDQRIVGDNSTAWRTSVSNRGDFRDQVEQWAKISVGGISELKALSPIKP